VASEGSVALGASVTVATLLGVARSGATEVFDGGFVAKIASAPPKRPRPDLEGRPPNSALVTDLALWLPRTALLPLHATLEYLVRRPLAVTVTELERRRVPAKIRDALTWGPRRASTIVPTALVDFGFPPSVGLYLSSDD